MKHFVNVDSSTSPRHFCFPIKLCPQKSFSFTEQDCGIRSMQNCKYTRGTKRGEIRMRI